MYTLSDAYAEVDTKHFWEIDEAELVQAAHGGTWIRVPVTGGRTYYGAVDTFREEPRMMDTPRRPEPVKVQAVEPESGWTAAVVLVPVVLGVVLLVVLARL